MEQVHEIQQMPPLVNQTFGEVYPGVNVTGGEALRGMFMLTTTQQSLRL
jgi:hypothetical protein